MSGNIILDGRLIKTYNALNELCSYAGKEESFSEKLWSELMDDPGLMEEFIYYIEHHTFLEKDKCWGYGLTDLYFFNMRNVEIKQDVGKNYEDTDKEALVLDTFLSMADMKKNPDPYIKKLEEGPGMDRFYD